MLANFAPDAVMDIPTLGIAYRGETAIRAHFVDFFAAYPKARFDAFRPTADPDGGSIAVRFVVTLTDPEGPVLSMANCNFFELDANGRFTRVTIYTTAAPTAGFAAGSSQL